MRNDNSSPTITNCTFSGNMATNNGGGMFNGGSSPTITNCTFSGNSTNHGSGMFNSNNSNPTITNCIFSGNTATHNGGGLYNFSSSPAIINCTFSGNIAGQWGGGMINYAGSSPTITNCTFSANSSNNGGAMYNWNSSNPTVTNCILRGDSPNEIFNNGATLTISYSNVQGGLGAGDTDGGGNIDLDPLFVDPFGPDATPGTPDDDLRLQPGSPCIDAGNNAAVGLMGITTDLDGLPRFVDDPKIVDTGLGTPPIVDMGAYERQVVLPPCVGDIAPPGGNGTINIDDLVELLNNFGPCP